MSPFCPCSTDRQCHCARTAYEKMKRYAVRSLRWFDGTSPELLFCMCCVPTTYQWHMGAAHAVHLANEWQCHCVWCRIWEPDQCISTAQVAYAQHTSHERVAINAILWSMASVCTAHGRRTCRTYKYTSLYSCGNVMCGLWMRHLNVQLISKVQFNLANLISHVHHSNNIALVIGKMIGYL